MTDAVLGLGFPVYKFTYPEIMERVFPLLRNRAGEAKGAVQLIFAYCTYCRFAANSLHSMATEVEKLGCRLIAQKEFKCPSNGIASLQEKDSFEYETVMYFENRIDLKICSFASEIVSGAGEFYTTGKGIKHRGGLLDGLKISVAGRVEKARYPKLTIDKNSCIRCDKCAMNCPDRNLVPKKNEVQIRDEYNCLHCLRCLHICPAHSISFGELVSGPNRYTKKIRKLLYSEAGRRAKDAPERGTKRIKRRWALGNLKYWLFRK